MPGSEIYLLGDLHGSTAPNDYDNILSNNHLIRVQCVQCTYPNKGGHGAINLMASAVLFLIRLTDTRRGPACSRFDGSYSYYYYKILYNMHIICI